MTLRENDQEWYERPDDLRDALTFTASETGFSARLIEKDFYCSLTLSQLSPLFASGLVFKGGTALSKVHANFYRLSEDLDFSISTPFDARRSTRRALFEPVRRHLHELSTKTRWLTHIAGPEGANACTQYHAILHYTSCLTGESEQILFEVALREPLLHPPQTATAMTMLLHPLTSKPATEAISISVISRMEAYAEKVRAALCRRDPAIRDFYDLHHAVQAGIITLSDELLLELIRAKLAVPGNQPPSLSHERLENLRRQIEPQLSPVLREQDFHGFDLNNIVEALRRSGLTVTDQ